jgi:hypothetical protein
MTLGLMDAPSREYAQNALTFASQSNGLGDCFRPASVRLSIVQQQLVAR